MRRFFPIQIFIRWFSYLKIVTTDTYRETLEPRFTVGHDLPTTRYKLPVPFKKINGRYSLFIFTQDCRAGSFQVAFVRHGSMKIRKVHQIRRGENREISWHHEDCPDLGKLSIHEIYFLKVWIKILIKLFFSFLFSAQHNILTSYIRV